MYALASVRYRVPIGDVDERHRQDHRDYLINLKQRGRLIASGPCDP